MNIRKTQKGITLLALVITVIVLLIIATVALRTINNKDMIEYAQNATEEFEGVQKEEQQYVTEIGTSAKDNLGGVPENYVSKVTYTDENVPIPSGFKVIDGSKDTGLVIENETEGSQFVWIPVEDINDMVICQDCGADYKLDNKTLKCENCGESKLAGKLYGTNLANDTFNPTLTGQTYKKVFKEPYVLTKKYDSATDLYVDGSDKESENLEKAGLTKGSTSDDFKNQLQNEFNKMVISVAKYKGFYVGRYEMSLNGNKAQSKAGILPATAASADTWYGLYAKSKTYSQNGVISEMIWGCQWDAMMKFILTGEQANHVTSTDNVGHGDEQGVTDIYKTGGTNYLGTVTYNDNANNIYDLEGNVGECTQEAYSDYSRVIRGGSCFSGYPARRQFVFTSNRDPIWRFACNTLY